MVYPCERSVSVARDTGQKAGYVDRPAMHQEDADGELRLWGRFESCPAR